MSLYEVFSPKYNIYESVGLEINLIESRDYCNTGLNLDNCHAHTPSQLYSLPTLDATKRRGGNPGLSSKGGERKNDEVEGVDLENNVGD